MVNLSTILRSQDKMKEITKATVLEKHGLDPKRRCFATHTGIQQSKKNSSRSFSVKFEETILPIFKAQTGLELFYSQKFKNYFRVIDSDAELRKVTKWEAQQGSKVFLRDCLSLSIALDTNLIDNNSPQYTHLGALEHRGKIDHDQTAISELADIVAQNVSSLPFYKDADFICSVPPRPDKDFDLPNTVAELVSQKLRKQNVTSGFQFGGSKSSIKTTTFDEKWAVWESAELVFQNSPAGNVRDKTIVLIDDKYQSGITIQYVAMKLQQAGAHKVYGLSFVKTLRDTDNV